MNPSAPKLVEPLVTFLAATTAASALFWIGTAVPLVQRHLHGAIAVIFLYAPALAARLSGKSFDYREAGLRLSPVGLNLRVTALAVVLTWPPFLGAFLTFYGVVCEMQGSPFQEIIERLAPLCHRWTGPFAVSVRWPDDFFLLSASQLLVVAVPEELFFRGYLHTRLEARWPSAMRLGGAPVGRTLLVTSDLFALGHFLVDFQPQRLAVFFPGLIFGWMRARTGSIAAAALFHALCNLLSEVLHVTFFG